MARNIDLCLPGDISKESIVRVNHAGETAAVLICRGQLQGYRGACPELRYHMHHTLHQEEGHLAYFNTALINMRLKKSLIMPIWEKLSYGLGFLSGKLGKIGIATCTKAIEDEISKHYQEQLDCIDKYHEELTTNTKINNRELRDKIKQFRDEEIGHAEEASTFLLQNVPRETFLEKRAGFFYASFQLFVTLSCRVAIIISKRI